MNIIRIRNAARGGIHRFDSTLGAVHSHRIFDRFLHFLSDDVSAGPVGEAGGTVAGRDALTKERFEDVISKLKAI
jgi:hypothetical protein